MKKEEILETVRLLANSQGFYSGLLKFFMENSEDSEAYLKLLEEKNFKDTVNLIMYFES